MTALTPKQVTALTPNWVTAMVRNTQNGSYDSRYQLKEAKSGINQYCLEHDEVKSEDLIKRKAPYKNTSCSRPVEHIGSIETTKDRMSFTTEYCIGRTISRPEDLEEKRFVPPDQVRYSFEANIHSTKININMAPDGSVSIDRSLDPDVSVGYKSMSGLKNAKVAEKTFKVEGGKCLLTKELFLDSANNAHTIYSRQLCDGLIQFKLPPEKSDYDPESLKLAEAKIIELLGQMNSPGKTSDLRIMEFKSSTQYNIWSLSSSGFESCAQFNCTPSKNPRDAVRALLKDCDRDPVSPVFRDQLPQGDFSPASTPVSR